MPKFDRVIAGDVLYDVRRQGGRLCCWEVRVLSVDTVAQTAVIAWNGNAPRTVNARQIEKYRRSRPEAPHV